MENTGRKCSWIVFKIWFFAVLLNTAAGTIALCHLFNEFVFSIAVIGAYFGIIFSFPIFLIFLALLNFLIRRKASFENVMVIMPAAGIILTLIVLLIFFKSFGSGMPGSLALYFIAVGSAIMAIITQVKSIERLTNYKNPIDELLKI